MLKYRRLTREILDRPVEGVGIKPGPFRKQYSHTKPVLLVFLRHLACQFCKETVRDLRAASNRDPEYPDVVFFFQENIPAGQAFFNKWWPRAKAISDPELFFYREFGIPNAGIFQIASPMTALASIRAAIKGNLNSWPSGNIWQMPGFLVIRGDQVLWSHAYRHIGDRPPIRRLAQFIQSLHGSESGHARDSQRAPDEKVRPANVKPLVRAG